MKLAPKTDAWPFAFTEDSSLWGSSIDEVNFDGGQKGPGCVGNGWSNLQFGDPDALGLLFKIITPAADGGKSCAEVTSDWFFSDPLFNTVDVKHTECTASFH